MLCVGLGAACLGNVSNSILLGRWFGPKLSTAMAVVYSAMGAGVLILLPLSQWLIDKLGWQKVYEVFGGTTLCLLLPLLLLPWKLFSAGSPTLNKTVAEDLIDEGWTLLSAMRHHAFWALFSTFFFTSVGMFSISTQVVAYLVDAGFEPLQAATAWGFSGVVVLFGMLSVTWLDGVIGRRRSVVAELRHLDYRHRPALAVAAASEHLAADRLRRLLRQHAWLAWPTDQRNRHEDLSRQARRHHFRHDHDRQRVGHGSGIRGAGGLIHDLTGSYDALLAFSLVSVILGMIPFLVIPALRE